MTSFQQAVLHMIVTVVVVAFVAVLVLTNKLEAATALGLIAGVSGLSLGATAVSLGQTNGQTTTVAAPVAPAVAVSTLPHVSAFAPAPQAVAPVVPIQPVPPTA